MTTATISVPIDDKSAQFFQAAPPDKREQLQQLISYMVQQFAESTPESLFVLMDQMSEEARINGLTPEILDLILNDE